MYWGVGDPNIEITMLGHTVTPRLTLWGTAPFHFPPAVGEGSHFSTSSLTALMSGSLPVTVLARVRGTVVLICVSLAANGAEPPSMCSLAPVPTAFLQIPEPRAPSQSLPPPQGHPLSWSL